MRFGILLIVISIATAFHSLALPVYLYEPAFWAEVSHIGNVDSAQHFYIIQDKYITSKYLFLDYSICLGIAGILSIVIGSVGFNHLKSPTNVKVLTAIGVLAMGISILAYYGDSMVQVSRNLTPPWSPPQLLEMSTLKKALYFFISWLALHCVVLRKDFETSRRFAQLTLDYISLGLLSSTILAGGFVVISLVGGQPIYVLPALLWFYFHISLLAGKQSTRRME